MANDKSHSRLPEAWTTAAFRSTFKRHTGVGAHADLPEEVRFLGNVARLVRRRAAEVERSGEPDPVDIAIFLLRSTSLDTSLNAQREPMFDNGLTVLAGRLWFTAPVVASAHYLRLPEGNDATRFAYVVDTLELGTIPTVIVDPRPASALVRWYPRGLGDPDAVESRQLEGDVSPADVFAVIDRVHHECLVTPGAASNVGSPWLNASQHVPRKEAESVVHWNLRVGLVGAFPSCIVRKEQPQPTGRTDLEVEQPDPLDNSETTRLAILELKVLRSSFSTGTPVSDAAMDEWIKGRGNSSCGICRRQGSEVVCSVLLRYEDHRSRRCCVLQSRPDVSRRTQCLATAVVPLREC